MAGALDYLQKLSNNDWLTTDQPHDFLSLAQSYYQELTPFVNQKLIPKILIADPDPIRFLAKFLAVTAAELPVFLGNHQWGDREWQQVEELVQPNIIWQEELLLANKLIPRLILDLIPDSIPNQIPEAQSGWIMIPTGGSSGQVKFAIHTWQTLSASVAGLQTYFQTPVINSYCVLPVYHVSGLMQFMRSLLTGGKLIITTSKHLETNESFDINPQNYFISLVPTQLQKLLINPQTSAWLSQFRAVFLGGGAAWSGLLNQARNLQIPLALTYGMTETASQLTTLKPHDFLAGNNSCGQVLPHARIGFKVPVSGSPPTPLQKRGEGMEVPLVKKDLGGSIAIQSNSLALGYYPHLWVASHEFVNNEFTNILETDDLGYLDPKGYLYITGRQSLMIITGGEKVFPPEVEAVILATKLVEDVCVLGLPDPYWGEIVAAVYVPVSQEINLKVNSAIFQEAIYSPPFFLAQRRVSAGVGGDHLQEYSKSEITIVMIEAAIASHLTQHLAKYKHPKLWFPRANLPRNPQGKINYSNLREILSKSTQVPVIKSVDNC